MLNELVPLMLTLRWVTEVPSALALCLHGVRDIMKPTSDRRTKHMTHVISHLRVERHTSAVNSGIENKTPKTHHKKEVLFYTY